MAGKESDINNRCMIEASRCGAVLMKNVRGLFISLCGTRKVKAGLAVNGSSDLIGWKSIVITPDMVGKRVAVYVAAEIKTATGRVSPEQQIFIDNVRKAGGIAGICRSEEDIRKLLS